MNLEEQLNLVRQEKQRTYLKYLADLENAENEKVKAKLDAEIKQRKIIVMAHLSEKYKHIFRPDSKQKAARLIVNFVRKYWFGMECINQKEIVDIPGIYRFRVNITECHINEYSEENAKSDMLKMHRVIYKMTRKANPDFLFRYCFDIRKLYPQRHQIIELYDGFYFMQPQDHERIVSAWKKVNGQTSESIRFLNSMEFDRSLCVDINKDANKHNDQLTVETLHSLSEIIEENDNKNEFDLNIDREYLDNLNRQYINETE